MTPVERLLEMLPDAKISGRGWSARCPAHDDRRASLSISDADNGDALVHCHAGCDPASVVGAVGLTLADLMPVSGDNVNKTRSKSEKSRVSVTLTAESKSFVTANEAIAELQRRHGPRSAMWTYHDSAGNRVGVVVRWNLPNGKKDIRPVSRYEDDWRICGMPAPRPLYRLPEVIRADRVFVCEGEKASDAIRSIGLVATTSAHGCKSPGKTDWRPLAGKEIILLPDNDPPGRKYADTVATLLAKSNPAPEVKLVELPNLPEHGDAADFVAVGGNKPELEKFADAAPLWTPKPAQEIGPVLTCLADVTPGKVQWLWPGRIPLGRIALLVGRPGEGKSFLTIDAAARVTTGTRWPDGGACPKGSVILISAEDDPADTIRPRLDSHYADSRQVYLLSAVRRVDGDGQYERMIPLADVDAIQAALVKHPDCKLIVVDPP